MKIRELPEDIQKLAVANQIAQGNPEDTEIILGDDTNKGGFTWGETPEGYAFWDLVWSEHIDVARILLNIEEPKIDSIEEIADEFIKQCHVFGAVHAIEGGVIELKSLLVDFVNSEIVQHYLEQTKKK